MKTSILTLVFTTLWIGQVLAQTITGGIINSYARVTNISANQFDINNVYGNVADFAAGRTVLIIQMKGATVTTANNNTYGTITSYNNAGNYEFATVSSLTNLGGGDYRVVFHSVARTYDAAGAVQLVSVPSYNNVTITGNVTAKPWSAQDGTGGVVVLEVQNVLTLNASIDVSAQGFVGGNPNTNPINAANNSNNYSTNNDGYAAKGEGIALPNQPNGRGKIANGGGGGNPHNAGGGGGGNLGSGGQGGNGWPDAGGTNPAGGIGGQALTYSPIVNRIFMGGGGGAGQQNNNVASRGGRGGGIIILRAGTITSTNCAGVPALRAKGENAPNTTGNDGAGGGGAGGTILLEAVNITMPCLLTVDVSGGNGGNVNHSDPHGGGGGGGVGAFLSNRDFSAVTNVIAVPGQNGRDCNTCTNSTSIPGSPCPAGNCTSTGWAIPGAFVPLPVELYGFKASYVAKKQQVEIQWFTTKEVNTRKFLIERSGDMKQLEIVGEVEAAGESQSLRSYYFVDIPWQSGTLYYRLRIEDRDGSISYSAWEAVEVADSHSSAFFSMSPNPATDINVALRCSQEIQSVYVYDVYGNLQLNLQIPENARTAILNVETFPKGVYIVKLNTRAGKSFIERLVIQ
ncbi:hypothetical protein FHS56_002372 [Thermonema lapsum]|uniref:Secretion system C-terminal sorting domain-containing protein n=1 Tax=Thermonema lapsum TaxID=28195 RepID=A0A846MTR1_9BACT|nr:T9SS type A sorting domain-containing protein [Thermonema lapsum]NIK74839.1 hypothetical protein [Thermonema lapsum]